jgi:antitoxin MazE
MQVAKWGNSLAVRLPKALVDRLALKPGDAVEIVSAEPGRLEIAKETDQRRDQAVARMRERRWALPADYKFDREEINSRPNNHG